MALIRFVPANGSTVHVNPAHVMVFEPTPGNDKRTNLTVGMGKTYLIDEPADAVLARLRSRAESARGRCRLHRPSRGMLSAADLDTDRLPANVTPPLGKRAERTKTRPDHPRRDHMTGADIARASPFEVANTRLLCEILGQLSTLTTAVIGLQGDEKLGDLHGRQQATALAAIEQVGRMIEMYTEAIKPMK